MLIRLKTFIKLHKNINIMIFTNNLNEQISYIYLFIQKISYYYLLHKNVI
jgi:hypothetical protein